MKYASPLGANVAQGSEARSKSPPLAAVPPAHSLNAGAAIGTTTSRARVTGKNHRFMLTSQRDEGPSGLRLLGAHGGLHEPAFAANRCPASGQGCPGRRPAGSSSGSERAYA